MEARSCPARAAFIYEILEKADMSYLSSSDMGEQIEKELSSDPQRQQINGCHGLRPRLLERIRFCILLS